MAGTAPKKEKGMTVFKSDRHEDIASIVTAGLVICCVLFYMAFLAGDLSFKAPSDGKVLKIAVSENTPIKKGDILLTMQVKEKKVSHGQMEEKIVEKEIKSKMNGTVVNVSAAPGSSVKKDKDLLMVLKPEKGSLP
jgi:acetyl/propionyl-CoA carboxylase alpha subunit